MRKTFVFAAIITALILIFLLGSCSGTASPSGGKPDGTAPAESGGNAPSGEESPGGETADGEESAKDTLVRVLSIEGEAYSVELYSDTSGKGIGDFAALDVSDFEPAGKKQTLTLDGQSQVYIVENGAWGASSASKIKEGDYLVVTSDIESQDPLWVTIIR
jgi:hypothetical protein